MNLRPTFEHYYPEGVKEGQCAAFAEKLYTFGPVGDLYTQKLAYFKKYGSTNLSDIQIGDILLLKTGINGHVCIVNDDLGEWQLTESNWNLDGRVHHTRLLAKNNTTITAHLRAPIKVKILNPMSTFHVKVIANNQNWDFQPYLDRVIDWYWVNSNYRIQLIFEVEATNFANIIFTDGRVDNTWYAENVLPKAVGYDVSLLLLDVWNGTTGTWGWMNGDTPQKTMKIEIFSRDWIGEYNFWMIAHELSHVIAYLTVGDSRDLTHTYFTGDVAQNQANSAQIFKFIEYQILSDVLKTRQHKGQPMIIIHKKSDANTKFALSSDTKIGFADLLAYQKFIVGREVVDLALDDVEFNKIPTSQALIKT